MRMRGMEDDEDSDSEEEGQVRQDKELVAQEGCGVHVGNYQGLVGKVKSQVDKVKK